MIVNGTCKESRKEHATNPSVSKRRKEKTHLEENDRLISIELNGIKKQMETNQWCNPVVSSRIIQGVLWKTLFNQANGNDSFDFYYANDVALSVSQGTGNST